MSLRILFVHASLDLTPEYKIHRILAEHADPALLDCHFVWQDATDDRTRNQVARLAGGGRNYYWDFGRNMSLSPKPSRPRRAWMMAWRLPGSLLFLFYLFWKIRPDVVYTSQQRYEVRLVRILRTVFRRPHLIHLHYTVGPWLGNFALRTILQAPMLLACSEFVREWAIRAGVPAQHILTLLNPADIERFNVPRDRQSVRTAFGWQVDTPVIVAAGRLDPSKGHMLLLEAFAVVHEQLPTARLLICGATWTRDGYDSRLHQRANELGLDPYVIFTGNRRDLPEIFAGADVFCLATEDDPCPMVFLEAMVAGLPVAACRSGGVPEMVVHGQTGLLSDLGDAPALAYHVLQLLLEPKLAQRLGEAGRQRALTDFAPAHRAALWTAFLYQHYGAGSRVVQPAYSATDQHPGQRV